jgi:hypothetical protein
MVLAQDTGAPSRSILRMKFKTKCGAHNAQACYQGFSASGDCGWKPEA